jgi:protein-tyrosine-phosphatase
MYTGKIAAAAAAISLAALIGQSAPAAAGESDSNMAYVSRYVANAEAALQQDRHDYHGHRAAALTDIARARADIASALAYDNSHDRYNASAAAMANATSEAAFERSQNGSDRNLIYVRTYLERAIDMLKRDRPDYGGYRVKAIADLESARDQIGIALRQDTRTENPGQGSDSNIRYTRAYIQRGINMLQHDQRDYGGHRAAAVTAMQNADADLLAALRVDHASETVPTVNALALPAGWVRGQHASNQNIAYARVYVEHAMDMLQKDQHDYNGYRAKAVQQLAIARAQLLDALQYR